MNQVAIVNTGLSNVHSIARAIEECGASATVTQDPGDLKTATRIILPGVGAFPPAMAALTQSGMADAVREQVLGVGIPFLGICLGMQLLAKTGEEGRSTPGLDLIDGEVRKLEPQGDERVPHVGWNTVAFVRESPLFVGIDSDHDFYFVHSYALVAEHVEDVTATTDFGGGITAAVQRDLVFGVQFHPEKSQRVGFAVLKNFLAV
jgi:imidazole glycerol-phosphate synthase subunit HisH